MPVNHYFNNFPNQYSQEQALVEDLLVESIKMYGADCYYIVRESQTDQDVIFGEDPTSKFEKCYKIEMYMNDVLDHASGGDFMARFGLQITESVTMLIARRTFQKYVPASVALRPREGDLIYVPFSTNLYEIKYVDHEKNYYTLGRDTRLPYMYDIHCEMFRYSQESINTGVDEIDDIELEAGYAISMNLNTSQTGNFYVNELIYQGTDYAAATASAQVKDWDPVNKVIRIQNIKGVFANTGNITGVTSNTTYTIADYDPLEDHSNNNFTQNSEIQNENDEILVETEGNPFGSIG